MKVKGYIKVISLFIVLSTALCVPGCSSNEADDSAGGNEANVEASVSEDYFTWNGNIITGLTESGAKQESLVIPARCEGFDGRILRDTENNVTSVSFESDEDIELNGAFRSAEALTSISLPANLTTIADLEFSQCTYLEEITIPSGVTSIGAYAFQYNTSLTTVKFEGDVTEIKMHAFDNCSSLTTVVLPDTLTTIEEYAFNECEALTAINLPDSVTTIGNYAFYDCDSLDTVTLPSGLTSVGRFAFATDGIATIIVPEDLVLEEYAGTSFTHLYQVLTVKVVEGSWMDLNFDSVFEGQVKKEVL